MNKTNKTKFRDKFICPAPWTHLYYQINSPSPCHNIRNADLNLTPQEYYKSEWLKNIKQEMLDGKVPDACRACVRKEKLGLKSTRGAFWNYYNSGPEPYYEDMWFYDKLTPEFPQFPSRMEFRFSNLCNMKCRMCDETSSSEWAKEKVKFDLPPNPDNNQDDMFETKKQTNLKITEDKIAGLKDLKLLRFLSKICFTGGEPFLIKEYYDYLDFLIDNKLNSKIEIETFTNCSVYNPLFVDRLLKFKKVELVMSIDGVGKTAEYIRHGTDWDTVSANVRRFNSLGDPFQLYITVAISAYTLLDVSSLSKFLMELSAQNPNILFKGYSVMTRGLNFPNTPDYLRPVMIEQINESIAILTDPNWKVFRTELQNIKTSLLNDIPNPKHKDSFYDFTSTMDRVRNESFEETFGLPLKQT